MNKGGRQIGSRNLVPSAPGRQMALREGYIRYPSLGLSFRWNRAHTVNIFAYKVGTRGASKQHREIDVMSIGSFAEPAATVQEFELAVREYVAEKRYEALLDA